MNFQQKNFESLLPSFFSLILKELKGLGLIPTLVGGAVRDFLMEGKFGKDWDIELGHETLAFSQGPWKDLGRGLTQFGKVTFLSYDVIRLELLDHQVEFSAPRKENFGPHLAGQGHKNFSAEFDFKMAFEAAVQRRDFTINAMGIRWVGENKIEFLDPLDGLRHLSEKVLHPVGEDFSKDPIRFLRAIRFALKFKFQMSPELEDKMKVMDVQHVTPSYLWQEMRKSGAPVSFYKELLHWKAFHKELSLPYELEILPKLDDLKKLLSDSSEHEVWMLALEWVNLSCEPWRKYFSQSSETGPRLSRWASESRVFQKILPEFFHGEFDQIREKTEFETLFNWYFTTKQLLQKNPKLPLMKMIEEYLPNWIHLYRFELVKDVKHIDPPLRAKYQVWNLCQRI